MLADSTLFLRPTSSGRLLKARLVQILTMVALIAALVPLASIAIYIVSQGIGVIRVDFFTQDPPGDLSQVGG
ncbi:MAG: hypothetical protein QOI09_1830, partial [Chloroflexota bacterium]|nr:hypothetical protein [Chloroflexota bacterium]